MVLALNGMTPPPLSICTKQEIQLMVIANSTGTPDTLSHRELMRILKGQKSKWANGKKIRIALMKPKTPTGKVIANKIYGITSNDLCKYWLTMTFQGKSSAPSFFSYESDLVKYIDKTSGAIGVISATDLQPKKIILIDGKELL